MSSTKSNLKTRLGTCMAGAVGLALSAGFASTVSAETIYERQVHGQFEVLLAAARTRNITPTHEPFVSYVNRGQPDVVTLDLQANRTYVVFGACDSDCRDMDLMLYDENGELIDSDTLINDLPTVGVTPAWSGPFSIHVTVPDCRATRCTYGLLVTGD